MKILSFTLFSLLLICCHQPELIQESIYADFEIHENQGKAIIINKSSNNAVGYTLNFGDGNELGDQIRAGAYLDTLGVHQYNDTGSYNIKLKVVGRNGIAAEQMKSVEIKSLPIVKKDSILPVIFNIEYKLLDSGYVQFINNSQNTDDSNFWYADEYRSFQKNPLFRYYTNGTKDIIFQTNDLYGNYVIKQLKVDITNAVEVSDTSSFSGIIFNKTYNLSKQIYSHTNLLNGGGTPDYSPGTPVNFYFDKVQGIYFDLADFNDKPGVDYESMKALFTPGIKKISNSKKPSNWPSYSFGWNFWILDISDPSKHKSYLSGNNVNDFLEIIEVKEIKQTYLFPELDPRAFIVKFHIKTITPENELIDIIAVLKYNIYYPINLYGG